MTKPLDYATPEEYLTAVSDYGTTEALKCPASECTNPRTASRMMTYQEALKDLARAYWELLGTVDKYPKRDEAVDIIRHLSSTNPSNEQADLANRLIRRIANDPLHPNPHRYRRRQATSRANKRRV